mgnify:CR=1 FL=1
MPNNDPRIVAIAGESGSGKTTLALLLLGFLYPTSGNIFYKGVNLGSKEWPRFRREVQAIFQNPYEAFNPVYKIDHALVLPIKNFRLARSKTIAREIISQSLEAVGLNPGQILGKYPHQMSGGQLQRVMIARILMVKPRLIIADEPVSMIDASLRAVILKDLIQIKKDNGILLIAGKFYAPNRKRLSYYLNRFPFWFQSNIRIHDGFIDDNEIQYYLNSSDLVVIPRIKSLNSGNVALGFTYGRVVLGQNFGVIGEDLMKTGNPVFNGFDLEEIESSLKSAFDSCENGLGMKNKKYAESTLSWDRISSMYVNLIKQSFLGENLLIKIYLKSA